MAMFLIPYTIPILAQGIYAGIIGTISTVTMSTVGIAKSIYTHENPNVNRTIRELDIENRLSLIQAVLNEIESQSAKELETTRINDLEKTQIFEIIGGNIDLRKDPIELCIFSIHETIQNIHNTLIAIEKKVAYHNTKWFSSWRTLNIHDLLDDLRMYSNLLTNRFNDLLTISRFLESRKCS
jgi:hypothetical protein